MKANLLTFVRGLKNGTPPRFQSYLKSLVLLGFLTIGISQVWGADAISATIYFGSGSSVSPTPIALSNNKTFSDGNKLSWKCTTDAEGTSQQGGSNPYNQFGSNKKSVSYAQITFTADKDYEVSNFKTKVGSNLTSPELYMYIGNESVTKSINSTLTDYDFGATSTKTYSLKKGETMYIKVAVSTAAKKNIQISYIKYTMTEAATDYTITYNLTNVSGDEENPEKTDASDDLELYFYAEDSYSLPENIEVNVGSTTLTSSDYEWEVADEKGLLTLPKAKINGNITITIVGEKSCSTPITISKSPATLPSGCSFSLDKTSGCGDDAGESVLVTCSPATHYTVTAVSSTSGTPGAISNNKCTVSGIKESTTISVTFTEDTKYTITFADNLQHTASIPNTTNNEIVVYENEIFTFPTISDKTAATSGTCEQIHYHFMGWVLSTHEGTIAAGDIKTGTSDAVSSEATYYAVWAKEEL